MPGRYWSQKELEYIADNLCDVNENECIFSSADSKDEERCDDEPEHDERLDNIESDENEIKSGHSDIGDVTNDIVKSIFFIWLRT